MTEHEELGWRYDTQDAWASWESLVNATSWIPNAKLQVHMPIPGLLELRIALRTRNTYAPEDRVRVGHRKPLPDHIWCAGPAAMVVHLRRCLIEVVTHESDEWLVVASHRPFDPHHITAQRGLGRPGSA